MQAKQVFELYEVQSEQPNEQALGYFLIKYEGSFRYSKNSLLSKMYIRCLMLMCNLNIQRSMLQIFQNELPVHKKEFEKYPELQLV